MEGWAGTVELLEGIGRTLQNDPTDFDDLVVVQRQLQTILDRREGRNVLSGLIFFLNYYLDLIQRTFLLDSFMEAGSVLAARAEALQLIGKTLEVCAQELRKNLKIFQLYGLITVLGECFLDAVDLINGKAAEEAAASFQSGRVLDANP